MLLYDEFENLNAFLQRGILYTDLGLSSEATFDFEHVLALDRYVVVFFDLFYYILCMIFNVCMRL